MKKVVLTLVFGLFFVMFSNAQEKVATKVEAIVKTDAYQCPMDCEKGKTYTKPGSCPICKMDLKKVDLSKKKSTCSGESKTSKSKKGCCSKKDAVKKACSKKDAAKKVCSKKDVAKKCCSKK